MSFKSYYFVSTFSNSWPTPKQPPTLTRMQHAATPIDTTWPMMPQVQDTKTFC